jgi:hypothetical protein
MANIVIRVRLVSGGQTDLSLDDPDVESEATLIERVTATLAEDSGVLRSSHGGRVVVLYGRGVAGFEVSPRGAVL